MGSEIKTAFFENAACNPEYIVIVSTSRNDSG